MFCFTSPFSPSEPSHNTNTCKRTNSCLWAVLLLLFSRIRVGFFLGSAAVAAAGAGRAGNGRNSHTTFYRRSIGEILQAWQREQQRPEPGRDKHRPLPLLVSIKTTSCLQAMTQTTSCKYAPSDRTLLSKIRLRSRIGKQSTALHQETGHWSTSSRHQTDVTTAHQHRRHRNCEFRRSNRRPSASRESHLEKGNFRRICSAWPTINQRWMHFGRVHDPRRDRHIFCLGMKILTPEQSPVELLHPRSLSDVAPTAFPCASPVLLSTPTHGLLSRAASSFPVLFVSARRLACRHAHWPAITAPAL